MSRAPREQGPARFPHLRHNVWIGARAVGGVVAAGALVTTAVKGCEAMQPGPPAVTVKSSHITGFNATQDAAGLRVRNNLSTPQHILVEVKRWTNLDGLQDYGQAQLVDGQAGQFTTTPLDAGPVRVLDLGKVLPNKSVSTMIAGPTTDLQGGGQFKVFESGKLVASINF